VTPQVLLPWERLLWSSRPWRLSRLLAGEQYLLTDFRLLHITRVITSELALDDVGDIFRTESPTDRVLGTSTIAVHPAGGGRPLTLASVRRGAQLAALLELLAGDPRAPRDADAVHAALAWEPRTPSVDLRGALAGFIGVLIAIVAVAVGLHGKTPRPLRPTTRWLNGGGQGFSGGRGHALGARDARPTQGRSRSGHLRNVPWGGRLGSAMADARCRSASTARRQGSRMGNLQDEHRRADAQCHLRLPGRLGQPGQSRLYA
jgi:hypothetical protein